MLVDARAGRVLVDARAGRASSRKRGRACVVVVYPGVNDGGEGVGVLPCWCCRGGLAALRRAGASYPGVKRRAQGGGWETGRVHRG